MNLLARRVSEVYLLGTCLLSPVLLLNQSVAVLAWLWLWAGFFFYVPAVVPNNGIFGPVVRRFKTDRREVWLTIDDGPCPIDTQLILDLLSRHRASATFFLIGKRAAQHPELVNEILAKGHTIANHTYSHPSATFWMAGSRRLRNEIEACAEVFSEIAPSHPVRIFRSPAGMSNLFLHPLLSEFGFHQIGWSSRGYDAVRTDPVQIVNSLWKNVYPGAIILTHQGNCPPQEGPVNPRSLQLLLERLDREGYESVIPNSDRWLVSCPLLNDPPD